MNPLRLGLVGLVALSGQICLADSINGSLIPTVASIVDTVGATWTVSGGEVKKNGANAGSTANVSKLLYLNSALFHVNTGGTWYKWSGSAWASTTDPRVVSASGSGHAPSAASVALGSVPTLVDPSKNVWALPSTEILYVNGIKAASNVNTNYAYYFNGSMYCANTSSQWYQWTGSAWTHISGKPTSTSPTPTPTASSTPTPSPTPTSVKTTSIQKYATCSTTVDQSANVARAFAAAKNNAFTLSVDCALYLDIGTDIAKPIFIDNGTSVSFTSAGKFIVNNTGLPAFMIANSSNITLTNWNVEYTGSLSATASPGTPGDFSNHTLETWYANNRGVTGGTPVWPSTTNAMGTFYIMGDSSNINITGMDIYTKNTNPASFIPVVFAFAMGFHNHTHIPYPSQSDFPLDKYGFPDYTPAEVGVPNNLHFSNVTLDGTLMGFVGLIQNSSFTNIKSGRYSDLQSSNGDDIGGADNWFAPPHLFYFKYDPGLDVKLSNHDLTFKTIDDEGPRVGTKTRDTGSGDNCSFKLNSSGGTTVDGYISKRPDGFMDFISTSGMTLSNVTVTYNSSVIGNNAGESKAYPAIRFLGAEAGLGPSFGNVTFKNMSITDLASTTYVTPLDSINYAVTHAGVTYDDVAVHVNRWSSSTTCNTYANNANVDYYLATPDEMETIDTSKVCTVTPK